jgi:aspartyl-tRNA(Asn)/glutamyl-tRNA(Gln) amidotransferase subunit C
MAISPDEVRHVAGLARLELSDDELGALTPQLERILALIDAMRTADLADLDPMDHPTDAANVLRADEVRSPLAREQFLAGAPESEAEMVRIPRILDES